MKNRTQSKVSKNIFSRASSSKFEPISAAMEDELKKSFRGVKFIRMQEVNGRDCYVYKVYIGSSKMNTEEMTELLDITLQICGELGIEVEYE